MRIVSRYAIYGFARPFLLSLAVFSLFMFFGAAFDKLGLFSRAANGMTLLFKFLALQMPFFVSMIVPLATLIGVLFLIGELMATGQWKAFLAGGYRPYDIIKPLLVFSLMIACVHFLFNEFVAAPAYMGSREVYNEEFRKNKNWRTVSSEGSFKTGEVFARYSSYEPAAYSFKGILLEFYARGSSLPLKKINAATMTWELENGRWVLEDAALVEYRGREVKMSHYNLLPVGELPPPREIVTDNLVDQGTGFFALLSRISRLKKIGGKTEKEVIALCSRIAQPLSSLAMVLIGCAIMLSGLAAGKFMSTGIAVFTGFLFWSFTVMSERMAQIGVLGPLSGSFLPHALFSAASFFFLKKSRAF